MLKLKLQYFGHLMRRVDSLDARHQDDGTWKRTLDWEFDDIYDFIHSKHVLVANNNHQPIRAKEDIQLFERDLPGENTDAGFSANQPVAHDRPVEQCDVIQHGIWGYRIKEGRFRTPEDVCAMICRCVFSVRRRGSRFLGKVKIDQVSPTAWYWLCSLGVSFGGFGRCCKDTACC